MFTPKVLISFRSYRDAELAQKAQSIVTSLTGNTYFPAPSPTLTSVQTAIDAYAQALANAINGTKEQTILKNQTRDELEAVLARLATYVDETANDNVAIMTSSGFDLSKERTTYGILEQPLNIRLNPGIMSGCLEVTFSKVSGAKSYLVLHTEMPVTTDSVWIPTAATKTKVLLSGLTSGKQYAVKIAAVGADEIRNFSAPVMSFVV